MRYKIDFSVSSKYSVVERAIFRLVCNGVQDIDLIKALLIVFSDEVIATAVRRLVNDQVLRVDLEKLVLQIPDAVLVIMNACHNKTIVLDHPPEFLALQEPGFLYLPCYLNYEAKDAQMELINLKIALLNELVPGINVSNYAGVFDLYLTEEAPLL